MLYKTRFADNKAFTYEKTFRDLGSGLGFSMGLFDIFKKKKPSEKKASLKNLFFKSNKAAYEYSQEFFSSAILEKKALVLGVVYLLGPDKKSAYIKCTFEIDSEQTEILVVAFFDDFNHPINVGDFVSVGIVDIGKVFKFKGLENAIQKGEIEVIKNLRHSTIGTIVQKLTTELDLKSGQFVPFS